jgi:hypothetical protein
VGEEEEEKERKREREREIKRDKEREIRTDKESTIRPTGIGRQARPFESRTGTSLRQTQPQSMNHTPQSFSNCRRNSST